MSIVNMRHKERNADEEDSLFGSPPPSPGRPASPTLALPSSSYYSGRSASTAAAQNVGTTALSGSHLNSDLPIHPLALSLNHGIVHRPPALPHQMQYQPAPSPSPSPSLASEPQPASSAALVRKDTAPAAQAQAQGQNTSAGPSTLSKKKPKKRTRPPSRDESPPKHVLPDFVLPDPTAPPPTHFLRNQENLLGRAGHIARVKPATLTHTRGSTPSNPILVDDEDDRPTLGRRPPRSSSEKPQPYIDPALLTAPTNQEIVSVLIGQKDIFPILEGVLKLVMGNTPATRPKTGFERTTRRDQPPPTSSTPTSRPSSDIHRAKKRKLNRVPAGATDWDVPYPFPQGEGPDEYHKTWERERGKQLISQLIQLIKSAARKAATKKYLVQHQKTDEDVEGAGAGSSSKGGKQRRRRSAKDSSDTDANRVQDTHSRQPSCDILQDMGNTPSTSQISTIPTSTNPAISQTPSQSPTPRHPQTDPPPSEMDRSMAAAFDQLMSSLDNLPDQGPPQTQSAPQDAATGSTAIQTQTQVDNFFAPQNALGTATTSTGEFIPGSKGTTPAPTPVDQPLFDTWMSLLESFPMNFDGTPNALHAQPSTSASVSTSTSQCSTTTPGTPLGDFDFANMLGAEMADAGAGMMNDFDAMLASMFQQEQQPQHSQQQRQGGAGGILQNDISGGEFATSSAFGDHLIDPNLLALSLENQAASSIAAASSVNPGASMVDFIPFDAISPMASGSSLGGSTNPGTPVSAGWELSMPDVFMDEGGTGSGLGDGQGMWRSTMWDFGASAYEGIGQAGWTGNVGDSGDVMMDFGVLPEMEDVQLPDGSYTANAKGKGKEREVDSAPVTSSISLLTPASIPTSTTISTPIPAPSEPLLHSSPTPSQPLYNNAVLNPSAHPITRPLPETFSRQLKRDDIIKRAEEQKHAIQRELDAVKIRLWETTIEQAGLVTLQKKIALKALGQSEKVKRGGVFS